MVSRLACLWLTGSMLALGAAQPAVAQSTAPSSITPSTLRPDEAAKPFEIAIPDAGGLEPPAGAENLAVRIDTVVVEGAFPELSGTEDGIVAPLKGRRVTLAEVYHAASAIEAAYARAGFVLARVVVPPQSLADGGTLHIVIVDGFIEDVDVSGVPARVRRAVAARVAGLKGRHHLKLGEIEQPLLIANEVPGLTLSSTLMRGAQAGGTRLVLAGKQALVSGRIGADNSLVSSLGTYGFNAQLSLNSALGLGEQIYGFAASGYDVSKVFRSDVPVRVLGGGVVLPVGDGRLTLNPEATFSRTQPTAISGTPQTRGDLRRLSMRAGYTIFKTRAQALVLNATVEQIDETNALPQFGVDISHDRFMAARLGATYSGSQSDGTAFVASAQVSQGLGGLAALRERDLSLGTTLSRQGASLDFTKLNVAFHALLPLPHDVQISFGARGQSSFGKPLFRSEQSALEGSDALSAYVGGETAVDEAVTARAEVGGALPLGAGILVRPYVFLAGGIGRIDRPTVLEPGDIGAGTGGAGLRGAIGGTGLGFAVEYAHGFSSYAPLRSVDRVNASISLSF